MTIKSYKSKKANKANPKISRPKATLFDNFWEDFCYEIETGGFSILSQAAKDKIKDYIRLASIKGYDRGFQAGSRLKVKKKE